MNFYIGVKDSLLHKKMHTHTHTHTHWKQINISFAIYKVLTINEGTDLMNHKNNVV